MKLSNKRWKNKRGKQCFLENTALGKHLLNNHSAWYTFFCRQGKVVQLWHFKDSALLDFFLLGNSRLNYSDFSLKFKTKYGPCYILGLRIAVRGDLGCFLQLLLIQSPQELPNHRDSCDILPIPRPLRTSFQGQRKSQHHLIAFFAHYFSHCSLYKQSNCKTFVNTIYFSKVSILRIVLGGNAIVISSLRN